MAITKSVISPHGLSLPDAYIRIGSFSGTKDLMSIKLEVFVDEDARLNGKQPLYIDEHVDIGIQNGANMSEMYAVVKTFPDYIGATDV